MIFRPRRKCSELNTSNPLLGAPLAILKRKSLGWGPMNDIPEPHMRRRAVGDPRAPRDKTDLATRAVLALIRVVLLALLFPLRKLGRLIHRKWEESA